MKNLTIIGATLLSLLIAACGQSSDEAADASPTSTTITGTVVASPVAGASVTVKDSSGGSVAGPVTAGSDGTYSVDILDSELANDLIFESTGGTYTDEATGTTNVTAGTLNAHVTGGTLSSADSLVYIRPSTTIVKGLVAAALTKAQAEARFSSSFGYTPDSTVAPSNLTDAAAASGDSDAQKLAGLRAASFSQLTSDLGIAEAELFDLLTALTLDSKDMALDGEDSGSPITVTGSTNLPEDIQNKYEKALVAFWTGVKGDLSLASDKIGTLPFAKVALTTTYKITYVPGSMAAMEGKTQFTLNIANRSDDSAASGLTVTLNPTMQMPGSAMGHGSPTGAVTDNGDGTYTCKVYYLMASKMGNGMSMGLWQLGVTAGGESATFYPSVMMAMGDTVTATLKGQSDDQIVAMMVFSNRLYYVFKEMLSGSTGNHTLKLFVAAKETMSSYEPVTAGATLTGGSSDLVVTTVSVETSEDGTSWSAMTDGGDGVWTSTTLTGLTDGTQGTVYVRLTVNGTQKSTDGNALDSSTDPDNTNQHAMFQLTPM